MNSPDAPLDDWSPLEPVQREGQISALRAWLEHRRSQAQMRVLDLGCGDGSVIEQLAGAGAAFIGVDHDPKARKAARKRLRGVANVNIIDADFTDFRHASRWAGDFNLVLCLGHTWMLVSDDDLATDVLERVAASLVRGGSFVIDNFPGELWPLVESGDWQTGLSEDGSCQMILDAGKGLVALRYDDEIDEECEAFKPTDRLHRLWTMDELGALAGEAGFALPRVDAEHHLIWFDRL